MASTNYLINFYEKTSTLWKFLGERTLSIYNHKYHPYINIVNDTHKLFNIPISIDLDYQYSDDDCNDMTFNYKGIQYGIRFDQHSHSAFSNFKTTFNKIKDKKFFTKYYDNGRIKITGEYSNGEYNGCVTEYHNNEKSSIKFEGEMEDDQYVEGTFLNKSNTIKLQVLNITANIINGYIKIIYSNGINTIEDDYLWQDIEQATFVNLSSSTFVEDICKLVYGNSFIQEHKFKNLSTNEQLYKIYSYLNELNTRLENIEKANSGIFGTVSNIYNYIFNRR